MFYISISNGLLKDGHRKRMGEAVWEFMWCLDRITKIDDDGIGWVYGGKPINLKEISEDMEVHEVTVSRNLNKLKKDEYILVKRTGAGLIIGVNRAKKRFNNNVKSDLTKTLTRFNKNVKSDLTKMLNPIYKDDTISSDNINDSKTSQNLEELVSPFKEKYGEEMIKNFLNYWTQKNLGGKKELWQMQKVFDVKKRLITWAGREWNKSKSNLGGIVVLHDGSKAVMKGGRWVDARDQSIAIDLAYYPELKKL